MDIRQDWNQAFPQRWYKNLKRHVSLKAPWMLLPLITINFWNPSFRSWETRITFSLVSRWLWCFFLTLDFKQLAGGTMADAAWGPPYSSASLKGLNNMWWVDERWLCHRSQNVINNSSFGICTCGEILRTPAEASTPVFSAYQRGQLFHSLPWPSLIHLTWKGLWFSPTYRLSPHLIAPLNKLPFNVNLVKFHLKLCSIEHFRKVKITRRY